MATATSGTGWQLASDAADCYERYLVPAIFAEASRRLVAASGAGPGDRVLDAACGTAIVSRRAASVVGQSGAVTAVDANPGMLAVAARVTADVVPAVVVVEGDVAALPLDDDVFDVTIIEEALQFVDDPAAVLRELGRVTRAGGTIAASTFRGLEHHPVYAHLTEALGHHVGERAAAMMASPFSFGSAARLRAVAAEAGLVDVRVLVEPGRERFASVRELVRQEAASSPLADELRGLDGQLLEALVADLAGRLRPWSDDDGICFSNETHVLTARVPTG